MEGPPGNTSDGAGLLLGNFLDLLAAMKLSTKAMYESSTGLISLLQPNRNDRQQVFDR